MRIALIRHSAPLIEPGICYGRLDVAVDPGAEERIGWIAANPDLYGATCVWSSPSRRCRGLAGKIALALGVPVTIDPRLQELDFGAWEGLPWAAIARADIDRWTASPLTFAPPGGESGAALIARISAFHAGLRQARQDCAVVSHGGPLKILAALLSGHSVDLLAAAPPLGSIRFVTCPAS
jgi:alpha-ribazole phosphatase